MERKFRLDRTAFSATTVKEAGDHTKYWKDKTYTERLEAAFFLIRHAYQLDADARLDKSVFSKRKR
jgi:hypothetical protein